MESAKLLSIGETASILGVHIETLRKWDREGRLVSVKTPGKHRRYKLKDIENFCEDAPPHEEKQKTHSDVNKMPKTADRCKETTTTTGTGTLTLAGAVSQFQAFNDALAVGDSIQYAIVGQTGTEWEVGIGTLASSSTLTRDTVISSSNSNALVNLSSGTKDVFATLTNGVAQRSNSGQLIAKARCMYLN